MQNRKLLIPLKIKEIILQNRSSILVESLLALAIFMIISVSIAFFGIDSLRYAKNSMFKNKAIERVNEFVNAVTVNKNNLWSSIVNNTGNGNKKIVFQNNTYNIVDGTDSQDGLTFSFIIENVNRDTNGNIVTSGGTPDPRSRKMTITANWTDVLSNANTLSQYYYINNWNVLKWEETTAADFNDGTKTETIVTQTSGGEVILDQVFFPDWCRPSTALTTYDIPGNATAKTVFGKTGRAYLGTGGNATGVAFTNLSITGVTPPILNVDGTFNGYITNNIFVEGNYAYLATSHATKKVVILDISALPYTEIGYYSVSNETNIARSVYVLGTVGYVAIGQYVHTFNLTAKTGSRARYSTKKLVNNPNWGYSTTANVSKIIVRGSYLFASLDQDWYELVIVNVSNPSNMSITSNSSVNNSQTFDIYVTPDGNRTYFGTGYKANESQFFIINTQSKSGSRPIIGSYRTDGMTINAVAIIEADQRAIIVGTGGTQQYVTLNISNEATPTKCGGMALAAGINDIDGVTDAQGNVFSYFVTNDAINDFQIVRGGPGNGGGSDGYGYVDAGSYTSSVFDSTSATTYYYNVEALGTIPNGAGFSLTYQVKGADASNMTTGATAWMGPNGTSGTSFSMNTVSVLPSQLINKRYIQYKFSFTSDTTATPVVNSIKFSYQK